VCRSEAGNNAPVGSPRPDGAWRPPLSADESVASTSRRTSSTSRASRPRFMPFGYRVDVRGSDPTQSKRVRGRTDEHATGRAVRVGRSTAAPMRTSAGGWQEHDERAWAAASRQHVARSLAVSNARGPPAHRSRPMHNGADDSGAAAEGCRVAESDVKAGLRAVPRLSLTVRDVRSPRRARLS